MKRQVRERDDLEVALVDDPEPSGTRTVELRPRRRRAELLLAAVAIATVIGVGLIGDGDGEGRATATPTTTRRPAAKPVADTKRSTTTMRRSTSRAPTTTTTWPQHEAGAGPLVPDPPTGLHLAALNGNVVTVIDAATGDRCRTRVASDGAWMVWNVPTVAGQLLVQTRTGSMVVDDECAVRPMGVNMEQSYPVAADADAGRMWMGSDQGDELVEHRLPSGERTGRTVDLPRFGGPTVVVAGDDVVIGLQGEMTLVDPDTGTRRDLGVGTPLASNGNVVAFISCPELECGLGLVEVSTGSRQTVGDVVPTQWEQPVFSPDGRFLRVPVEGSNREQPASAVVDLETGSVRVFDVMLSGSQITPDNRWLVGIVDNQIVAYSLESAMQLVLAGDLSAVQGFALL